MNQHLRAIYEAGVLRPLEAVSLSEHQEVALVLQTLDADLDDIPTSPIWEFAAELASTLPDDEWEKLPIDGATALDHYLYGVHKGPRNTHYLPMLAIGSQC
ncbi:hypothetical protein Thiowin_04037 [Thiorhodovibrio winogradskyi]|uniref:DUF104 domain-containing protein n=1 Tax=Thiorhodovibrio winogradskyi TaxID=77007 RepID=A0ABZ0SFU4_9GAMM|nr:antitoxin family protein [Thiorhodovibrio winogradskyi]